MLIGGARIGTSYWVSTDFSWPKASLTIEENEISLKTPIHFIRLERNQVIKILPYRGIINDGIQIHHSTRNIQSFIVFWISHGKASTLFKLHHYPYEEVVVQRTNPGKFSKFSTPLHCALFAVIFTATFTTEYQKQTYVFDAFLNAATFTAFIGLIYFIIRRRMLKR